MTEIADFLETAGWASALREPLAGDASSRRYERLVHGDGRAVLMIDPDGDTTRFSRMSRYLDAVGLSAPAILAEDAEAGLMLIEDFGDAVVARLCDADPSAEVSFYQAAGQALAHLHRQAPPPGLVTATPKALGDATDLAFVHYADRSDLWLQETCAELFETALSQHAPMSDVVVLRDFHAENIIWLPDRSGIRQVGLLDFQDALIGHRAYDLVSLVRDARRDVSSKAADAAIEAYLGHAVTAEYQAAMAVLGAQRNLRILGVFARLARVAGKPRYIDLVPRVWAHLQKDLGHPALEGIRAFLQEHLPHPTPEHLMKLRSSCRTQ